MKGTLSRLYHGETNIDFVGRRNLWFALSGVVLAVCVVSLATNGLNYGIEFEGGVQLVAPIPEDGPLGDASEIDVVAETSAALPEEASADAVVQVLTTEGGRSVSVQTKEVSDPTDQAALVAAVGETVGADPADVVSQRIGSKWGAEVTDKALQALIVFLVVVTIFISIRFEPKMALAALAALGHDLLVTAGVYSLVGFEVTPSTIIAILTILGYSLYDTVVVFDKLEENTKFYADSGRLTYEDSANLAMNQVFMRSLNTSLATLLPVAALLFVGAGLLGAGTLEDLALALFVGILSGTYSSIFVATPVLALTKENEQRYRNARARIARETERAETREPVREPVLDEPDRQEPGRLEPVTAPAAVRTPASARPQVRPPAGSKKAKRRKRR